MGFCSPPPSGKFNTSDFDEIETNYVLATKWGRFPEFQMFSIIVSPLRVEQSWEASLVIIIIIIVIIDLRQEVYVFAEVYLFVCLSVCLFVCLSVCNITQKVMDQFWWNFQGLIATLRSGSG